MTMFYIMNGDTLFDTVEGMEQINVIYTLIWTYLWIFFGQNVVMNITLAQVEHGYLEQKVYNKNAWITNTLYDPEYKNPADTIEEGSSTAI